MWSELSSKRGGCCEEDQPPSSHPPSPCGAKPTVVQSVSHVASLACAGRTWLVALQACPLAWDSGPSLLPGHRSLSPCHLSLAESAWAWCTWRSMVTQPWSGAACVRNQSCGGRAALPSSPCRSRVLQLAVLARHA